MGLPSGQPKLISQVGLVVNYIHTLIFQNARLHPNPNFSVMNSDLHGFFYFIGLITDMNDKSTYRCFLTGT